MVAVVNADAYRQTGRTTRQMQALPQGAVFVWVNGQLSYPKALARRIGREDLRIVGPSWVEQGQYRGMDLPEIEIDHAIRRMTERFWRGMIEARTRVRP